MALPNPTCTPTTNVTTKGLTTVTFTGAGTCDWTVPAGVTTIDADVVGGGGSGGVGSFGGGGGGGGQVVMLRQMPVTVGTTQTVTVGAGGAAAVNATTGAGINGNDGSPSTFLGYSAAGGLAGKKHATGTSTAGAGGGSYAASTITAGVGSVSTVLNAGGAGMATPPTNCVPARNGGGGAGSMAVGFAGSQTATSSNGGAGVTNALNGASYGGGGGGHRETGTGNSGAAAGGAGGGGTGGRANTVQPSSGVNGTGGGGGGMGGQCIVIEVAVGVTSGAGGSGTVVIQYANPAVPNAVASGWQGFNQLAWDAYQDTTTTGYKVYWSTSAAALSDANIGSLATTNIVTINSATTTTYSHPNLALGTTYYYRVAASYLNTSNVAITSAKSSVQSATPQLTETVKYIQAGVNDTPRVTNSFDVKDFVVPAGVTAIQVKAVGAGAGATSTTAWGNGGSVLTNLPVTPGETLKVYVGSQPQLVNRVNIPGWNGGGTSAYGLGGYGGGASDIRRGGTALANRVIVAGGGGGRSASYWGGNGGGLTGANESGNQVAGGTQTGPGAAPAGTAQILGTLGVGASATNSSGAGGGGYYGGNSNAGTYGGGGGSSYTDPSALNTVHTQGGNAADGYVAITYAAQNLVPTAVKAIPGQAQNTIGWARTNITGATGYKVYGGTTVNPTTLIATINSVDTLAYVHTGLTNGTTYYYRVTATVPANFQATIAATPAIESGYSAEVAATPNFLATEVFNVTRANQPWTVPQGVNWIQVTAKGAAGGATTNGWGNGGIVSALVPVTPGEVLNLYVGSQPATINGVATTGYNGGGTSGYGIAGYGGGATDIRRGGTALANRILVAGGGGGRAASYWGGPGGGLVGANDNGNQTAGGTQTGPGAQIAGTVQLFGALGVGGSTSSASGAGGGGYWGGNSNAGTYAGGGGSSYATPTAINVIHTQATATAMAVTGDGSISISYPTVAYPVGVNAIPAQGFNTIIWDQTKISGATGYKVYGGTTPNPTTVIGTVTGADVTSYKHTSLTIGTTYYYRVTVISGTLESQKSAETSAIPTFTVDKTFKVTRGLQTFTVPSGVSWLYTTARGAAAGATTNGWGNGGIVSGIIPVTPGEVLNLYVGSQPDTINGVATIGYNGGGTSGYGIAGYGGGATDIRRGGTSLADRIMVAGGGGGRSASYWGGPGGGLVGGTDSGNQTAGGTQTSAGWQPAGTVQIFGTLGVGASTTSASGAGGGGYWGGNSNAGTYGGGGGSSYASSDAVNVVHTQAGNIGDGTITITYVLDTVTPTVTGVSSPAINSKTYKAGEDIYVDVNFSESVLVTGSPTLDLNAGLGGQRTIAYVSGSGTASLRFLYTVLPGDDKTNLDIWSTTALALANGATIADGAGNNAALTLPTVGSANSLAPKALVVDGIIPGAPVLVGASGTTQITIDWSDVTDADLAKYNVYVSTDGITFNQLNSVVSTQASPLSIFTQQIVARGITYYYYVTTVDIHGNESAPSMTVAWSIPADGMLQTPSVQVKRLTNDRRQPVTGMSIPSANIDIMDAGAVIGSITADSVTGAYSFTPSTDWSVDTHDITARASLGGRDSQATVISKMTVDTVAPTFTSQLRSNPAGEKTASVVLVWKLTFSEPMTSLDTGDFEVTCTSPCTSITAAVASVTQTFGTTTSYDVRVTGGNIGSVNGGIALAFKSGQTATDIAGNPLASTTPGTAAQNYILDHSYPVVTISSNKSVLGGGGQTASISFDVSLDPAAGEFTVSDVAVVGGTLSNFAVGATPNAYSATFTPTTGYQGTATIDVPGGSFNSTSGLANLRATQLTITVDTVSPTVTNVTASPTVGTYKAGAVVPISVTFSEPVTVTGTPTLKLETGTTDQLASYASGSGTSILVFNYTVVAGDTAADLNYFDTASLVLPTSPAASIKDPGLNAAVLTLPAVTAGTVGNLATNAAIVIDTTAPATVSSLLTFTPVGGTVVAEKVNSTNTNLTATFTYAGDAAGGKAELIFNGIVLATVSNLSATASSTVTFNAGATSTATLQAIFPTQMTGNAYVRITDAAGNVSTGTLPVLKTADFTSPTISAFTGLATTVSSAQTISITTSEDTTDFVSADIVSSCGGTGTLSGSAHSFTYSWTPAANTTGSCTFTIAAGAFTDAAGNPSVLFNKSTIIDNVAPTVTGVTAVSPNGTYLVGQSIDLAVNFSEPVTVVGSPTLAIKSTPSGTPATATYVSGSGTNKLVFTYAISVGDNSADLNYAASTSLAIGTGITIKDAAGNNATLTLPAVTAGTAGNLATNAAIVVDALAPTAPGAPTMTIVGGAVVSGYINSTNTNITASISGLTAGDVTGGKAELLWTPTGGNATVVAADTSISLTDTTATFDLGSTTAAALQSTIAGGTNSTGAFSVRLTDVSGNVSSAGTSTSNITVDYIKPTVTITSGATGTLKAAQTATITFTSSEATSTLATGDATANLGTIGAISSTSSTVYTATFTPNADGVWSVTMNAAVFTDAAGNPNTAATPVTGNADVTAPTAVKVSALDALYKSGDTLDINVEFSEAVNVDVARTITLALTPSRTATYLSGNGTNKVVFRYTVQNGDQSLDLNYAATGNWTGTGNVTDLAGNVASSFALPASTSTTASLAGSSNVRIDALAPTAANAPTLTVTPAVIANSVNAASTNLTIATTWTTADATLSQIEYLIAGNVVATQTIASPATATSASYNFSTTTAAGLQAALSAGGAVTVRLVDIAGNTATSTATNLSVDYVAPGVTIGMPAGTMIAGQTRTINFTLTESASNFAIGDVAVTNGTLGSFTGSGSSYSAVFTPTANFTGSTVVSIAAGAFTDAAGNSSTAATSVTRSIDTAAPTVTLNRTAATSTVNNVSYTVTGNESIDCSTLSTAAGVDFTLTGASLTSIDQTDSITCTVTVTANATRGSPATVVIAKAGTFSISDANGNTQTSLTITSIGNNATIVVTIPTIAPSAPTDLAGTPAPGKALLTWTAPIDTGGSAVTSYVLQKTTVASPASSDWVTVASGDVVFSETSATVSNLTNGTDYYFRVLAVNISGNSPYSVASAAINPYDVPGAPTIAATASANQITVAITAGSTGGRAISAYQWTIDGGLTWTAFSTTNLSQTITGLVNGNAYSIKVRALNAAGAGTASNTATATPTGLATAPTISGIAGGNGQVVVSFTAPLDNGGATITNYEYSVNGGTSFTALATPSSVSPMTITGLTNGTTYSIKIRAVTSAGFGAASTAVNGYPLTAPSAPSALSVTPANGSLSVGFTPGATGGANPTYTATATPVGGGNAISAIGSGSPISITGLTNGTAYTVSVIATNTAGSSSALSSGATSYTPSGVPSTPQVTNIDTTVATQLTLTFTSTSVGVNTDAWEYKVLLNNNVSCLVANYVTQPANAFDGLSWISAGTGTNLGGSFTATGLTTGSCYDFIIRTRNSNGYSEISRASGMPIANPGAPTNLVVTPGNGQVTVSFSAPLDNGGVPISDYEYKLNGGSWVSAGTTSPFTITGLTNGTSYSVVMRTKTVDATPTTRYSVDSTAANGIPATVPAQVVYNGSQVIGDGFIDFPLSSVPGNGGSAITGYQYSTSTDGTTWGAWTNATWTAGLTVRVGGLTNSTSGGLYYKLRAVNALGVGAASAATGSALTSGIAPATPTITAVAHDGSATLTYTPGATGGFTPVTIQYSLDGTTWQTVTSNPLVITGLTNGTTYNLQVRATNAAGSSVAATASVTPAGAAGAPTITSVTSGSTTATVSFTAPTNTGGVGVVISSYEISINGGLTWSAATLASGNVSSGTIDLAGLVNGAVYPVQLRAVNAFGQGAASTSTTATRALPMATVPTPPTLYTAVAGRNLVTVTFFAPLDDGGAAISSVQYTLDGTTWITAAWNPLAQSGFDIAGLTNGTTYTVALRVVNSAGASASSNSATATPSGTVAALAIISGYTAAAGQAAPTATDFADAGITNVPTGANLAALNSILASLPWTDRMSSLQIQAIVNAFNKLVSLADGINNVAVGNPAELTVSEWALLGQTLTTDQAKLANDVADNTFFTALDTAAELAALTTAVSHVIPLSSSITVADAAALGLTAINSSNIASLQALVAAAGSAAAVDTQAELIALAAQAETNARAGAALAIISAYDTAGGSTTPAPTVADYAAAGVTGVDAANLASINQLIGPASSTATDTAAEVQAFVDAINKVRAAANGSSAVAGTLIAADFTALGLTTIDTAVERSLFNQLIAGDGFAAVDTIAERAAYVTLIDKLLALAASTPPALPNPTLTLVDLAALGITGVDSSNLSAVLTALANSANDGTGVDTIAEIQAIATAAAAGQAALNTISGYTAATGQTAPTATDYATAGVTGVTSSNLAMVNAFIAALPAGSRDSAAEIQAIVDAVNHLISQANGVADGGTFVTATDLTALGIATTSGTATAEVALFNAIIDGKALTSVDTLAEVQALMTVVSKITAQASGATGITISVADFTAIGLTGVNSTNLTALMNQIAATADNGTEVDTVAELNALVTAANAVAVRDNALAAIIAYNAANGQTAPTTSTYSDATVTGVSSLNIDAINSIIASLPGTAKDTAAEIQAVVNAYAKVAALADATAANGTASALTGAEFATLGLGIIGNPVEISLMNAYLDASAGAAVDTASELSALATAVSKLAATAAVTPPAATPTPGLTLADLAALGINGATADNLATIIAFIANSANDGTGIDTKAELQALVNAAAAQAIKDAMIAQISLYDGTQSAPTRNNYADAGITGVDLTNRDVINSIVAQLPPAQTDSAAELQAIVTTSNKIIALADGTAANGSASALTATDTAALGIGGVDSAAELALFNEIIDGSQIGTVDTYAELAEIARVVQAIMLTAAGGTPTPALTVADYELLGITGLDSASLSFMAAQIAATADNGTGIDSLIELQTIATLSASQAATAAALALIAAYDGTNQAPVLSTYSTAGVTGVTSSNLTLVNSYVAALTSAQSDTAAEVQATVDALAKLAAIADAAPNTGAALTAADLTALGVNNLGNNVAKLSLLNSILDTMPLSSVNNPGELAALVDLVNRMVGTALGETVVPGLSAADFAALGLNGVTDAPNGGNLSVIVAAIAGSGANGTGVDTFAELSAVVDAAVADYNLSPSLKAIIDYANSNLNPIPTVIDYNGAGASMVDAETLDAVNAIVDSLNGGQVSSTTKVYQIVYDLFVALGKIVAFVQDPNSASAPPTVQDYKAAGLVNIDANSATAMNAVIAGLSASDVDSTAKLAALLQKILAAAAAQQNSQVVDQAPSAITKVVLNNTSSGALVLKWTGAPSVQIKVISSSGQTQSFVSDQQKTGQIIDGLEAGRAYAIILAPVGSTDPNASQTVAYAVPAATPIKTDVVATGLNKVQLTWAQEGFAKLYKIVVTPNKGAVQTFTTGETKLDLAVLGGRKYDVTVTAIGEGDGASQPAMIDLNPTGAVTSVVATPFAKKKQTLVSWKPLEVKANAKYVVKVDGKVVCTGKLTSCVVTRVLTAKNDVVVSVVGGAATAVDIEDNKLVYQAEVTFLPNTTVLSAGATASIKASAAKLKKAGYTKVVVTGHANPVDGVPIAVSDKLANERALLIATQLKKLLPGVRVVAVGRSVFSPAKQGAANSISNIRAEIYGTK